MKTTKDQKFLVFKKSLSFRKAQFWYGDFLVAVLILMIIGFLFVASIRDITSRNEILKDLILDASDISSVLMSEGSGIDNWGDGRGTVGFITDNKLDENKLIQFSNLNYAQQRTMLGTLNNVWIYLADRNGEDIPYSNGEQIRQGLELLILINSVQDIDSNNLVHIKRFVFYDDIQGDDEIKGDIYVLGVVVWQ